MRTSRVPRSRIGRGDARDLRVVLEQPLGARPAARGSRRGTGCRARGRLSRRHGSRLRRSSGRPRGRRRGRRCRPGRPARAARRRVSPSTRAGNGARGRERVLERHADLDEVPHGLRHRQRAPREDAVLAPHDVVGDDDLGLAQGVRAVADPGAGDRVGDERDPPACGAPEEPDDVRVEVDAVDDRLDDDVRADERRADDPGVAVGERPHRVEDVRDGADATVERGVRLGGRRVACARARP